MCLSLSCPLNCSQMLLAMYSFSVNVLRSWYGHGLLVHLGP